MTNKELVNLFIQIELNNDNILDIYTELDNYKKEYAKMPFSKIKNSIFDAYELYHQHKNHFDEFFTSLSEADLTNIVEAFDLSKLFDQIPEEYRPVLQELLKEAGVNE